ncbi:Tim17/Tim22/Tim23/Pmp24 family-domain-containing protein [Pseudomassariella vexata]|uniref:Mitochondrial import inner membrane translocase subunit TIM22 n=1 Tax=Pseudomassariella vexata TaxID=1141098 RepID=A0A1Y2EJ37_9PEZI|nr:Tim17/Tim22/Tim23/Pmp24 family-domain-containing protein [Pseudomassariella vexata]ORY71583.1 Tim17/Tim22/Tim23/Pmp24 family-domain-containing protein [Pseudomassariella vexata]
MNGLPGGAGVPQGPYGPQTDPNVKAMQAMMESCFGKTAISGVMGFGMGGLFGMFMASMQYDTPYHVPGAPGPAENLKALSTKEQVKIGLKDMGSRSYGMAKNFGKVGGLFAGIECGIEGFRAKNDMFNGVAAGCLTGGILARSGGPIAAGGGCAAFAAFSAAIDAYMRSPGEE